MPANLNPNDYQATTWGNQYHELTCPSGQKCLVQRVGLQSLMQHNLDPDDLDLMTAMVEEQHVSKKSRTSGKAQKRSKPADNSSNLLGILRDQDKFQRVLGIMDKILMASVVAPKIISVPEDGEDRDPESVYPDMVSEEDKVYIANFTMGGTKDLERFRRELKSAVDSMDDVEDVEDPAE